MDTSPTVAQTKEIADWIDQTITPDCKTKYFWTTHAHGDHFLGFPVLQKRQPGIQGLATAKVLQELKHTYEDANIKLWQGHFVDSEVIGEEPTFSVIGEKDPELDGHMMKAYDDLQGDSHANSFMHVQISNLWLRATSFMATAISFWWKPIPERSARIGSGCGIYQVFQPADHCLWPHQEIASSCCIPDGADEGIYTRVWEGARGGRGGSGTRG